MNEKDFLQDPGTVTSYYSFSLCLLVLSSAASLRTLVVFGAQPLRALKLFGKKENMCKFLAMWGMDANPIRVAPECRDRGRTCTYVSWCFWLMGALSEMTKECMRKGCYGWRFLS
jgi:hypothetical protein